MHNDTRTFRERVKDGFIDLIDNLMGSEIFQLICAIFLVAVLLAAAAVIIYGIATVLTPNNSATETEVIGEIKTTQNQGLYTCGDYFCVGVKKTDGTSEAFRIHSTDQYPVDPIVFYQTLEPGRWYKFRVWGKAQWNLSRAVYKAEPIDPPEIKTPNPTPTSTGKE